jgi:hypothetical protein
MIKAALIAAIAPFLIAVILGLIEHFTQRPRSITYQLGTTPGRAEPGRSNRGGPPPDSK